MSLDQARAFLARMQIEPALKQQTLAAATATPGRRAARQRLARDPEATTGAARGEVAGLPVRGHDL